MKAIHNKSEIILRNSFVGNYKLKYNFESNSQLKKILERNGVVGNYKLKYNFESNSQLNGEALDTTLRWEL